jgi:hypothetical protein
MTTAQPASPGTTGASTAEAPGTAVVNGEPYPLAGPLPVAAVQGG